MAGIGGFKIAIGADTKGLRKGLKRGQKAIKGFTKGVSGISSGLLSIAAPIAGIAGLTKLVQVGMEFEKQVSDMGAFIDGTDDQLAKLGETAESLGRKTQFSAAEAASAMVEMGKAGLDANQVLGASEGVLTLAAAGGIGMAEAATIAAATLNQFKIDASEMSSVVDMLAKSANSGSITMQGMGDQLSMVAATARNSGLELAETSGIIATLATELGAEKSGVAFRAMLVSLQAPSKQATKWMDKLSLSTTNADDTFKPLAQIIEEMGVAFDGLTEGERAKAMNEIFNVRGLPAFTTLMNQGRERIEAMTATVANSDGFGLATAEKRADNVAGALARMKSAAMGAAIDIYQVFEGPLKESIDSVADSINFGAGEGFTNFAKWAKDAITVVGFELSELSESIAIMTLQGAAHFGEMFEGIGFFFTSQIPELLSYMADNWISVFRDIGINTLSILENIGSNIAGFFSGVWDTVSSMGEIPLTFQFKAMSDGTVDALPGLELSQRSKNSKQIALDNEIADRKAAQADRAGDFYTERGLGASGLPDATAETTEAKAARELAARQAAAASAALNANGGGGAQKLAMASSREAYDIINRAAKGDDVQLRKQVLEQLKLQTGIMEEEQVAAESVEVTEFNITP